MRHLPKLSYKGLTVVLQNPSRFDQTKLLTGYAGDMFEKDCLQPYCNKFQCDIRTLDTLKEGFLPDTKGILFLGEKCLSNTSISLHAQRGAPTYYGDIASIHSYFPQDCLDPQDYEGRYHNANLGDDDEPNDENSTGKDRARTDRTNWKFWLMQDTKKLIRIIEGGGKIPIEPSFEPVLYPPFNQVCNVLDKTRNSTIICDIETDYERQLYCIGFNCVDNNLVFVVPICLHDYSLAYAGTIHKILKSLILAFYNNTIVFHNGAGFDLFLLAWKYHIGFGRKIYDTMLAQQRCFPEQEKSLAHCISMWTMLPYHKNEGHFNPRSYDQFNKLLSYNAKDVWGTRLVWERQQLYAAKVPGLKASIDQVNKSIRPYLINSLFGIRFNDVKRQAVIAKNDRMMTQYLRMIKLLAGKMVLPTSNKQCADYFYEDLGYDIVKKSAKTGQPSCDEKALQKLKLKHMDNVMIDLCLAYRALKKETGSLGFLPWKA